MAYTKNEMLTFYKEQKCDKTNIWLLFLLLGWSYGSLDQMGKQIFYLTLGGLGLWSIYLLFTLNSKVKDYNLNIAKTIGLDGQDLIMLGLI